MNRRKIGYLTLIFLLVFTGTSLAQNGFFMGFQAGISSQRPSLEEVKFDTNTRFLYGLRAGIKFMMITVEANYFQAAHDLKLHELISFSWGDKKVDYNYLGLNLKYYFSLLLIQPYITFGLGYYSIDIHEIDKDTDRGYNFGLGLEVQLGKKISLLAEAKYHRVKLYIDNKDFKVGDFSLIGGMSFYF